MDAEADGRFPWRSAPRCANSRGHDTRSVVLMYPKPILGDGLCACGCGLVAAPSGRYAQCHSPRGGPVVFWGKVPDHMPVDTCWPWQGSINASGYGTYNAGLAHRAVYMALVGPIPDELQLDHLCRNRRCVNPAHLEPVTVRENVLRGENRASRQARQTHCQAGHPLYGENVYRSRNGRHRKCRICRDAYMRAYRQNQQ